METCYVTETAMDWWELAWLTNDGQIEEPVAGFGLAKIDPAAIYGLIAEVDIPNGQDGRLADPAPEAGSLLQDLIVEPHSGLR